ncbi:MAG: V-type ATP synthase subunit I [Alistipes sp.]|jgi:V/A-type H+-transporting ATPase subunit I|nr:V-type ATP synthase subunit I [Alistipes sp.]
MIVKMSKYTFVVLASGKAAFLERLQELGMVDVTVAGWEPSEEDRALVSLIERHGEAVERLRAGVENRTPGEPFATGAEAFDKYEAARREVTALEAEIAQCEKAAAEARPWGEFDPEALSSLASHGVVMKFFTAPASELAKRHKEWSRDCTVEQISEVGGTAYFTAVAGSAEDLAAIGAQEARLPAESVGAIEKRMAELRAGVRGWDGVFARAAATLPAIESDNEALKDRLQFNRAASGGTSEADGSLVVMEAWAREKEAAQVDEMIEAHPDVIGIKERPAPQDEVPVELRNSWFATPFEFIGQMYALPKYGTMDLTRWFAPFYMLFFAFCLSDAGYGLLLLLGGLFVARRGEGAMGTIGKLSAWCGGASVVFGFFVGSLFGIDFKTWGPFAAVEETLFFPHGEGNDMFMFMLALALGVLQMLFGMVLRIVTVTRVFGVKYALSTVGWLTTIVSGGALAAPGLAGIELGVPAIVFKVLLGAGVIMMLFMNSPGKNPFINLGAGLWNTYNDVVGLMSDALSYIRLFAIGLSGGVLALVFNDLAAGMSPDIPGVKQLVMLIILLIGHGLNLFMSTLSSMVHPMRLTFVEFYKNAGFEMTARQFDPLKRGGKN